MKIWDTAFAALAMLYIVLPVVFIAWAEYRDWKAGKDGRK